jgi:AraC-like DNA-binding protein
MDGSNRSRYLREEYLSRINRVIDHIDANLDKELRLEQLARIANFSPYHFHRIFKALVGEPLNQFIQRIRLERAAAKLIDQPKLSITEIACDTGFSSSSSFARATPSSSAGCSTSFSHGRDHATSLKPRKPRCWPCITTVPKSPTGGKHIVDIYVPVKPL